MAEAHRHGIVHRDLKPGNILLDRRGEPVVADFGLALRGPVPADAANLAPTIDHEPRLTQAGVLMGTPAYMPPEQARGELDRIGPSSDVYASGAILFELLTGKPPFPAAPLYEMVRQIENQPVPAASTLRRGVPAGLDAVCQRTMAKDPTNRFASMEAFSQALAPFAVSGGRRWVRVAVATAVLGLLLAFAAVVIYVRTDNGTVEVRLSDASADVQVTVDGQNIRLTDQGRVTNLRAGPHGLEVKGPNFETVTRSFKVTRGVTTVLEVMLQPKKPTVDKPSRKPGLPEPIPEGRKLARLLARGRKMLDQGRFAEMRKIADEALRIDPQSPGALALRSTFRAAQHDLEGAREDAEAALKLNPETPEALIVRAIVNGADGKPNEAIADETAAIRLESDRPRVWSNRAKSYIDRKNYRQSIADASRAIELKLTGPDALMCRGGAYAYLGEYEKALQDYDAAEKIAPNEWRVFDQRSALHAKMGNAVREAADWSKAKKLNPSLRIEERVVFPDPPKPPMRKKFSPNEVKAFDSAMKTAKDAWDRTQFTDCGKAVDEAVRIDPTGAEAQELRLVSWHSAANSPNP